MVFSLVYKKLLIQLIIKFCDQNWNIMVYVDVPFSGLDHIYLIESNMFLLMEVILTYFQLLVVYHKVMYWVHYFSSSISTIYQMLLRDSLFISLHESKDLANLTKTVNKELILVKKWLDANKLSLNIDKTNFIIFHSSSSNVPSGSNIKIGTKQIRRVKFVRFLGILLDEHLSWKYHISELAKKLSRTCGMFFKIRNLLPLDVLVCLYNPLFCPSYNMD